MKILYVVSTLKRCGPTNQLFGIIRHLDRSRFEPTVLTLSPEPAESRRDDFAAAGITVRSLALGRVAGAVFAARRLARVIAELRPGLLHSQGFRGDLLCAQSRGVLPHVATVRNYPYKDYVMTYGRVRGHWMARRHLGCLQQVAAAVFVSQAIRDMAGFSTTNTRVVHNGVDTELYAPAAAERRRQLRHNLGLPPDREIFISTGHLDPRKDPAVAIDGVLAGRRDALLLLLGSGTLRNELESRYRDRAGQVRFAGRVANVHEYLQASDWFVSASLAEGLPNAVLEALACGLPCFLSDIAEHREIVAGTPLAPLLFRAGDREALGGAVAAYGKAAREELGDAARRLVEREFSQKTMSERYQALYAELAGR
ncbi:MAG: glycosyltransferase [Deltaproteobacteria bacterium]|nr:MAG: glycosyltransferase [Deltaproteobacteria bacterium]